MLRKMEVSEVTVKRLGRCKLCGKVFVRSVTIMMEHLLREHLAEFVERCERGFFVRTWDKR